MSVYKIGATLQILLEFEEAEWDAIYPYEEFLAEAEITGGVEYQLTTTINATERTILLSANTAGWAKGRYKCDIRVVKNGVTAFIPSNTYITFELIAPVAEVGSLVDT